LPSLIDSYGRTTRNPSYGLAIYPPLTSHTLL
jgi:hypothetical protein